MPKARRPGRRTAAELRGEPPRAGYDPALTPLQAEKLCRLGAKDAEIADFFGMSVSGLRKWFDKYPALVEAMKRGKLQADANVADALYHRAIGYSYTAVKIMQYQGDVIREEYTEHCPPDVAACFGWLQNRRPDLWRDSRRIEVTGKGGKDLVPEPQTDIDVARRLAYLLARADAQTADPPKSNGHDKVH